MQAILSETGKESSRQTSQASREQRKIYKYMHVCT